MSISSGFQELKISVEKRGEKVVNKTQICFPQSGDDNANRLSSISNRTGKALVEDTGYNTSSIPPLVSQSESSDKLLFWGSEQQCMEPDVREFNLLESQEIHTFLRSGSQDGENEDDDEGGSLRDGKDEGPMSISSSSTASSVSVGVRRNDNDSNSVEGRMESSRGVQKRAAYRSAEDLDTERTDTRSGREGEREKRKGGLKESKSETNVFVSSLSAVSLSGSLASALDNTGGTQSVYPVSKIKPYAPTGSYTSAQTSRQSATVEATQGSPQPLPQEKQPQILAHTQRPEGSQERNRPSFEAGLGQRRKTGFEERPIPPRRQQLVRPLCQTEMGRARSLEEASPHQVETRQPPPFKSAESHMNGSNKKIMKSSLREPSDLSALYHFSGVSKASQKEVPAAEKPLGPGPRCNSSPSDPSAGEKRPQTQFTYRRNCSSPNRTGIDSRCSTPPHSPLRTPQGSPRRQPTMYLVSRNVSGVGRHVPSGYSPAVPTSAQGNGNSSIRPPLKTCISTSGIPKAPPTNQQSFTHTSSPKESSPSPKLKPKGVRPKIITCVRKNPQFTPQASDGPYQVSSLPTRLSAHGHQTGMCPKENPKEPPKPSSETRGTPVLSASNLLYDRYRHEMQANILPPGILNRTIRPSGHTHTVPPAHTHSHTAPPKLGSKADTFYGAPSEVGRSSSFKERTSEEPLQTRGAAQGGGSGSLLRSGRGLRLGLGAVTRTTLGSANKGRGPSQGLKSTAVFSQPAQPVRQATCQKNEENTDEVFTHHAAPAPGAAAPTQPQVAPSRSLLPKAASQSGLRPPGFTSRVAAGRLAAFGFVRSSSVSSVTSAHSADSTHSDPCRTAHPPPRFFPLQVNTNNRKCA
ncbi:Microtubule-associated tumor suppressor candidate 2 -like protein [Takifugu flavidus]|uniref:Microtubule-associated tumor suppressor candidate 2-like protein n=1 Tax=Takifugu flavidus TaxID=433684 RepID=A0A5C6P6U8_9TELE|nr:Microtubule-associated tumor suppressor candidate 2 -like protein [Takifugu flavidus]